MSSPGFSWRDFDAYLFDIDGTLLNVRDAVHYFSFHNAVRDVYGVQSSIDGVPVHGNTDIGILRAVARREGIPDREFESKLPRAIQQMCAEVEQYRSEIRAEICPSVKELLHALSDDGKLLGVVSGNLEPIGWTKLRVAGIAEHFSFGCFSDRYELREDIFRAGLAEVRRRLGPRASACVVGDTPSDIAAAKTLQVPIIAVATGTFQLQALRDLAPDLCVGCCTDLLSSG